MIEEGNITGDRFTPIPTVFQEDINENVELTVQQRLVKAGITEHALTTMRQAAERYMRPITSKNELEELQTGILTPLVKMRTRIERICKKGREEANMIRNAWIAEEKTYTGLVKEIEEPLQRYKDEWKEAQERVKREEEAEAERQRQFRYAELEGLGCVRRAPSGTDPERYVIGGTVIPLDLIDTADAPTWENLTWQAQVIADELRAKAEAEEAARLAEANRQAAIAAENERKGRELAEQERLLREREEQARASINAVRKAELIAIGYKEEGGEVVCHIPDPVRPRRSAYLVADLHNLSDKEWASEIEDAKLHAEERAEMLRQEQERKEKEAARAALIAERVKALKDAGWEEVGNNLVLKNVDEGGAGTIFNAQSLEILSSEDVDALVGVGRIELARRKAVEEERIRQQERERLEAEAKAKAEEEVQRKDRMSDVEKWEQWTAEVKAAAPKMSSPIGRHAVNRMVDWLDRITPGLLADLKK